MNGRAIITAVMWCAAAAALVTAGWANARPGSFFNRLILKDPQLHPVQQSRQYADIDQNAHQLAEGGGDIGLAFEGLDADDPQHADFASRIYFRSAYALYPQRVYVSSYDRPINDGTDLLGAASLDPQWLAQRRVRRVAVLSLLPDGEIWVRPVEIVQDPS